MPRYHTIFNLGFTLILMFSTTSAERLPNRVPGPPSNTAEVELLIICDQDFSDRFQNDSQKMIDYWTVYMSDIHMRFQSLHNIHITFRVTSLIAIHNADNQPFVENARENNRKVLISMLYREFGIWVRNHESDFPGFDVALLVTGAELDESESHWTYYKARNSACTKLPSIFDDSTNVIILHSSSTWGNACSTLAASLATVLGADDDKNTLCSSNQLLMGNGQCGVEQYYFSNCSDAGMANFLMRNQSSCLRIRNAPDIDILKSTKATHPPTMTDQCKMVTGNLNAAVANEEVTQCIRSNCTLDVKGTTIFVKYLFPLDNSPCGNRTNSFCFRGRCLHQGHILQYAYYDDCYRLFYWMIEVGPAYARVVDCIESPTLRGHIRIDYDDKHGSKTVAHVLSEAGQEIYELCLRTADAFFPALRFSTCAKVEDSWMIWDTEKIDGTDMYLLRHRKTRLCLNVDEHFQFQLASKCNKTNKRNQWIFVEQPVAVPMEWHATVNDSGFATSGACVLIIILYGMLIIM